MRWRGGATGRASGPPGKRQRSPVCPRNLLLASMGLVALAAGASAGMAVLARSDLGTAHAQLEAGRAALLRPDVTEATKAFSRADAALARAQRRMGSWVARPGRLLPVVRENFDAATALVLGGREVAAAGRASVSLLATFPVEGGRLDPRWRDGSIDLEPFVLADRIAPTIGRHLARAERIVASSSTAHLAPPVRRARHDAIRSIAEARQKADLATAASFLVPRVLGADGPRRWVVGAENLGELRGRGGYIGSLGVLEADAGRLHMGPFSATTDLPALVSDPTVVGKLPPEYPKHYLALGALNSWPNLTMSPDFSSGASVLLDRLAASGGPDAGGVISADPQALSYLLSVTGPVTVEGLAEPVTAANVVEWSLNRAYFEFTDDATRKLVLGRIAGAVWERVTEGSGLDGRQLAAAVGRALVERHMVLYSRDSSEQAVIDRVGIGGGINPEGGDYLLVLGQNFGENKMDYYVERNVSYSANVRRDGSVDSIVTIVVRNVADPAQPLPDYIGGARPDINLATGTARTYVSVLVPEQAVLGEFRSAGQPSRVPDNQLELGKRLFGTYVDIGPGQEREISFRYRVARVAAPGPYRLTLQNQATVRPDAWSVEVTLPSGHAGPGALRWRGPLVGDRTIGG